MHILMALVVLTMEDLYADDLVIIADSLWECFRRVLIKSIVNNLISKQSKKKDKDQESIQPGTTPDPGHRFAK